DQTVDSLLAREDLISKSLGPLPTFACDKCHRIKRFSRCDPNAWNEAVTYLSAGLLYGREVQRPDWFPKPIRHDRQSSASTDPSAPDARSPPPPPRRPSDRANRRRNGRRQNDHLQPTPTTPQTRPSPAARPQAKRFNSGTGVSPVRSGGCCNFA